MGVLKRIERRKKSKIKKALKSYRGRFWKNLAIFMAGVFSSGFILAGVSAIVLKFVPLKSVTGGNTDKVVSSELADKSILDVLLGFKNATVDDYVIVTTLIDALQNIEIEGKKLSDFVYVDTAKLAGVKLLEIGPALKDAFTVTATLHSTVGSEYLNKFGIGKISAFNEFLPVMIEVSGVEGEESTEKHATVNDIDMVDGSFKAKLYYYKVAEGVEVEGSIKVTDGEYAGVYARAYNDDKSLANGVTNDTPLYYAALTRVPVTDAIVFIENTIGRVKATELLDVFGIGSQGIVGKLLKDRTLTELGNLDVDDVTIYELLEGDADSDMYKILSDATGKAYNEILIGDLSTNLDIYKIKVSTVFDAATDEMKSLFVDLVNSNKEEGAADLTWDDITIGNLQNIDGFDSVKLSSVMTDVYPTGYNIGTETDPVYAESGSLMADILIDAYAPWDEEKYPDINAKWDSLTVSGITSLTNFDNVHLSLILDNPGDLKKVLEDVANKEFNAIVVSDLNNLQIGQVHLATVMPAMDDDLMAILEDEFEKEIVLSDLENFEMGKLHLYKVLPEDRVGDTLRNVLIEITGAEKYEDIEILELYDEDISDVRLGTLLGENVDNPILRELVEKDATISTIGSVMNNLKLYDIYGSDIFVEIPTGGAPSGRPVYKQEGNSYKIVANEDTTATHYLKENAGIWLLLCFKGENFEVNSTLGKPAGRPSTYTKLETTFSALEGDGVSNLFTNARIGQLVDAGIINSTNTTFYNYTIDGLLSFIDG